MLKLALCDDDSQQRSDVGNLLLEYAQARPALAVKLSVFSSGTELLSAVEENGGFDLYLLDIVMPGLSGIELGVKLRELGSTGAIIYLTISPEYAVDSYAARAFHYLVKPPDPARLYQVLDQAAAELEKRKSACITVKVKGSLQLVRKDEILYAELADRAVCYHLSGGKQLTSTTLRGSFQEEVAPLLTDPGFFLCGASFVVNLFYVTAIEKKSFRLDSGRQIPLSRHLAAQARQRWCSYWLELPRKGTL